MERDDCGTAGQLLDSAFSPTIYIIFNRGRMYMNGRQVACTCMQSPVCSLEQKKVFGGF